MADKPKGKIPDELEYTISDLDQLKVVADPLRIRILEAFCRERTTKQVAVVIEEKPTKLYHHVEALEKVGLIRLSRTRRNRGTLERYYLAVARTFRTDSKIFNTATSPDQAKDTPVKDSERRQRRSASARSFERPVERAGPGGPTQPRSPCGPK